jgi:hypothetical protein
MERDEEYYLGLDKRTREYKQWKEKRDSASSGVGDTLEKVFKATGVADAVKFIAGDDCGCDERKEKLNKMFRYRKPNCLNEDEYTFLAELFERNSNIISPSDQRQMINVYNRVFNQRKRLSNCNSCTRSVYKELKHYFETYS